MNKTMVKILFLTSLFFLVFSCAIQTDNSVIFVDVYPDKIILEKEEIDKKEFEKKLQVIVDNKVKSGIKKAELTINLKVDKNTKRGDIADIEVSLRRLNVRKVIYSTFGKEQTSANKVHMQ